MHNGLQHDIFPIQQDADINILKTPGHFSAKKSLMKTTRTIIYVLVFILIALRFYTTHGPGSQSSLPTYNYSAISEAYSSHQNNVQVSGEGTIVKLLRDDLKGSRHQKMIVRIAPGHTILIAHNIDLAPRINHLRKGDRIEFSGEYEYNAKGGVVHWTHRDPKKRHPDGWIMHQGKKYH